MKKFSRGRTLAVVAVAAGAVLASVAPVMADVSTQSPSAGIKVEPIAKIQAAGAAVEIKVTYTCPAGFSSYVFLDVNQAVIGGVAKGADSAEVRCTGKPESVSLIPIAQDRPFRWGSAWVRANLTSFPGTVDERTVTILP
ncbi:hypothetical protein ACIA8G_37735 [Lentzea sp. NPDC051213]|uniref:hypothetical protein n=1 Tax=Lentzea sp. NPDC051213 TaxID=3364126 RepID=UPI00378D6C7E